MLLRQGWERRGGRQGRVEKEKASRAGWPLLSSLPFLAPLPLCLSFPTNKSSWIGWV